MHLSPDLRATLRESVFLKNLKYPISEYNVKVANHRTLCHFLTSPLMSQPTVQGTLSHDVAFLIKQKLS